MRQELVWLVQSVDASLALELLGAYGFTPGTVESVGGGALLLAGSKAAGYVREDHP